MGLFYTLLCDLARPCAKVVLLTPLLSGAMFAAELTQANAALQSGHVDEAATLLRATLTAQPNDVAAHLLLCRVFYAQDMADPAIHACELAVAKDPKSSDSALWLGRSYGLKAGQVSPFSAFGLAKKVREQFEHAAQLDPDAPRAASDLAQFYLGAPGIVGGGTDKAQAVIDRIEPRFPVYSHRLRALLAEKKKDTATAEAEFKNAIAAAKTLPASGAAMESLAARTATAWTSAAWIDLADFYQRHNRPDQTESAIQSALALRPKGSVLADAASILISAHRSPELAEKLLREYLASSAKTDESPAFKVQVQLGDLLRQRGDSAGAHAQYAAAVALASSYAPARKALEKP